MMAVYGMADPANITWSLLSWCSGRVAHHMRSVFVGFNLTFRSQPLCGIL